MMSTDHLQSLLDGGALITCDYHEAVDVDGNVCLTHSLGVSVWFDAHGVSANERALAYNDTLVARYEALRDRMTP